MSTLTTCCPACFCKMRFVYAEGILEDGYHLLWARCEECGAGISFANGEPELDAATKERLNNEHGRG